MSTLTKYWFARSGYFSVEVARIILALIYIYCNLWRYDLVSADVLYGKWVNYSAYFPKSIVALLFPSEPPPAGVFNFMIVVSKIAPFFLLIGLFSKTSLWICFISNLFIWATLESFGPVWSHAFNVILLCNLAFIFAPVGQFYSVDVYLRKRLWPGKVVEIKNGFWCVLLGQWAAALMFFSAFYHKVVQPYVLSFPWASTENLRNQTLYRYESVGDEVPAHLESIINNPLYYKTLAFANLVFQALVVVSLFCVRSPRLRLIFGLCFILEEIGLSFFFQLHDWQWFPLLVFFVDWDYFFPRAVPAPLMTVESQRSALKKYAFIFPFIAFYVLCATGKIETFTGTNVFGLRAYPFSEFNMYSTVLADKPGAPATIFECHYEVNDYAWNSVYCKKIKRGNYGNYNLKKPEELASIADDLIKKIGDHVYFPMKEPIEKFAVLNSVTGFSPPSQPAHLVRPFIGYSLLRIGGKDYYAGIKFSENKRDLVFSGFKNHSVEVQYINRQWQSKPVQLDHDLHFEKPAEFHYAYTIQVSDTSFEKPLTFLVLNE